ncbi:hypothetical protein RJT34_16643 [Clitoria ternatea]|uniref:Uncharacterized protein n=1 Tax=Clitoria ternatea TaxID=43366 RepID=A0AAN9J7J6_CLITE
MLPTRDAQFSSVWPKTDPSFLLCFIRSKFPDILVAQFFHFLSEHFSSLDSGFRFSSRFRGSSPLLCFP